MIKSITLTNFRQHRAKSIEFQSGFNLIKGNNEHGKTTVLEAIAYALFGAKALRQSIDQVVTWGEPVGSVKVSLTFDLNGTEYQITRGKSGAEIKFNGELITGQTETAKFIEALFNANAEVSGKLMLASQGSIRGALAGGPKATMELIEALADFDVVEKLIEMIQEKLPTGNTGLVEDRIKQLSEIQEPVRPDTSDLDDSIESYQDIKKADEESIKELDEQIKTLQPLHRQGQQSYARFQQLEAKKKTWPSVIEDARQKVAEKRRAAEAVEVLSESEVQALIKQTEADRNLEQVIKVYKAVTSVSQPQATFSGTVEELIINRNNTKAALESNRKILADAQAEVRVLQAKRITESACGLCGKDLSEVPEVVSKNSAIDAEIQKFMVHMERCRSDITSLEGKLKELMSYDFEPIHELCNKYQDWIVVDKSKTPWSFEWKGSVPQAGAKTNSQGRLDQDQSNREKKNRLLGAAESLLEQLREQEQQFRSDMEELEKLAGPVELWVAEVLKPLEGSIQQLDYHRKIVAEMSLRLNDLEFQKMKALMDYDGKLASYKSSRESLEKAQTELKQMNFNNALIKKIRATRPRIADKLWGVVLAAVSHYFSDIRGVRSTVTKADSGFQVDGHPVEGLSGSTLDALGLAVRLALTKTFLPNIRFMLLDEAGAACDAEREANMLGVLAGCDLDQVIHVSHSEVGDAFATHLVPL